MYYSFLIHSSADGHLGCFHVLAVITSAVMNRIQDAWGWCTGMTQRDGMGREAGGEFRMGNTCTPVADSC